MATRRIHKVRCKDPDDEDTYVDVKVYDDIAYIGPNGKTMVISTKAANAKPRVIDNTGGGNGIETSTPSRISHMERFTSSEDETQQLDLEILDAISFMSPRGKRGVLYMPSAAAVRNIRDDAGLGVSGSTGAPSRRCHTEKITDKKSDTPKEDEDEDFIGVIVTDAVAWRRENNERSVLFLPNVTENDTTQYVTDKNGDQAPPDNTDPNPYVKFPKKAGGDGSDTDSGPWLGKNPKSGQTGLNMPPDQGLLWKIDNAAGKRGPWWAYVPEYQVYEWSTINYSGCIGLPHWDVRCFPYCDEPYACGCESVWTNYYDPACTTEWIRWPCVGHYVNVPCGGSNPGPTATIPKGGYKSDNEAAKEAEAHPDLGIMVKLDFTQEPQDRYENPGGLGGGWRPSIWQIVGMEDQQPHHPDPDTGDPVWDEPSAALAKKVAKLLEKQWNDTSNAYNASEEAMGGCVTASCQYRNGEGRPFYTAVNPEYPSEVADWKFGCAIVDGMTTDKHTIGNPFYPENQMDFCGGLPPGGWWGGGTETDGCGNSGYRLWAFHPAFATNIAVVQLDEKVWDTSGDTPKLKPRPDGVAPGDWPPP